MGCSWSAEDEELLGEDGAGAPIMGRPHPCSEAPMGMGTALGSGPGGPLIYATSFRARAR